MTELNQVYQCQICGNAVKVLHIGAGQLVCCEQNMSLQKEEPETTEKVEEKME